MRGEKTNPKRKTLASLPRTLESKVERGIPDEDRGFTGERDFSYRIGVTRLRGDAEAWTSESTIATKSRRMLYRVPDA
jgi:hypothetical protein